MSWRLTPEERRIIERTRREGEDAYKAQNAGEQMEAGKDQRSPDEVRYRRNGRGPSSGNQLWHSVLIWVVGIVIMVVLAMSMVWVGSLI